MKHNVRAHQRRGRAKVSMKQWYRARAIIDALQDVAGLSMREISTQHGSNPGWAGSAYDYRYVVTERDLRELENLAMAHNIDPNDLPEPSPQRRRGPQGRRATAEEMRWFRDTVRALRQRGVGWDDINSYAAFHSKGGVQAAMPEGRWTGSIHIDALRTAMERYTGGAPLVTAAPEPEPEPEPYAPAFTPLDQELNAIRDELSGVRARLQAIALRLPRRLAKELLQNIIQPLDIAIDELTTGEEEDVA